jgi:hypothetical protein
MARKKIMLLSDDAYNHFVKNVDSITKLIQENENNSWVAEEFPKPIFIEKNLFYDDFTLVDNPDSANKDIDFDNSLMLYQAFQSLPEYILSDPKFWLWLHLDKFYSITRNMMHVKDSTTIKDHWLHYEGTRRGLFFGVLSRCFLRVKLTKDNTLEDPYELTKWVIDNTERFRTLSWRTYSSQTHLIRGIIKGERKAVNDVNYEDNAVYEEISKYIKRIGSVQLLDVISEEDIEDMVYKKMIELLKASSEVNK